MSGKVKHGRNKRFAPSCVFKDTDFHKSACDNQADVNISDQGLGRVPSTTASSSSSKYNPKQLFRRLPLPLRVTANSLNLPVNVRWQHKAKVCDHCVQKLKDVSETERPHLHTVPQIIENERKSTSLNVSNSSVETDQCLKQLQGSNITHDHSYSSSCEDTDSTTSSESDTYLTTNLCDDDSADCFTHPITSTPDVSPQRYLVGQLNNTAYPDTNASKSQASHSISDNEHEDEYEFYRGLESTTSYKSKEKTLPGQSGDDIIEQLKALPEKELLKVAQYLGESQASAVRKDSLNLCKNYSNLDNLTSLNVEQWLSERNPVVVNFIKGVSGQSQKQLAKRKTLYSVAKAVEQTYSTHSIRNVFPLSFSENVVAASIVNSKLNANINGLSAPAGSYWTIKSWLENQSCNPLPDPKGDCICAFDNNQVIGRSYHVRANNKVKTSVITSLCVAEVDPLGTLQQDKRLKPAAWKDQHFDSSEILNYDSEHNRKLSDIHYQEVYKSLQYYLDKVYAETSAENGSCSDNVDKLVADAKFSREWKICQVCNKQNPKTKRLCESCRAPLKLKQQCENSDQDTIPASTQSKLSERMVKEIDFFEVHTTGDTGTCPSDKQSDPPRVRVLARDPVFVNPNSFESLIEVFLHIGKDFHIKKYIDRADGNAREWLLVICDGLPYTLSQRVVDETFHCDRCGISVFGKDGFTEHCTASHDILEDDIVYCKEFDWVHLRIGYGHYEMNMVRSLFELNWEIIMKDLALCMGFRSENAQRYAKQGSDHHKSWELLSIFYEGTIQELLVPFVRFCKESNQEHTCTPEAYLNWTRDVKNPKYQYVQEQILTYVQSILNFRKGVRFNDDSLIKAGKFKHAPLFHARKHPKYQQIELIESRNDLIMPSKVKDFVYKHQSISATGQPGRGEDMDFQLENLNKRSKVWTPKGVPCEADWLRTFRNLEKLDKMRSETLSRMGCEDPERVMVTKSSHVPQEADILEWRVKLRESEFLTNPMVDSLMHSMSGEHLDDQLVFLTQAGWSRRRHIFQTLFQDVTDTNTPDPVFVLPEERTSYHDIKNQTKEVIASKIRDLISCIDDEEVKFDFLEMWNSIQRRKKDDYLVFYETIKEEVESRNTEAVVPDDEVQ